MARELLLENPRTGAVKPFRYGFDWILFVFSGVLGIPLFIRRLPIWGGLFVGLWAVGFGISRLLPGWYAHGVIVLAAISFGMQLWLGFYGREMILKGYVRRGWRRRERVPRPRQGRKRRP
jgi:hypothetical protein